MSQLSIQRLKLPNMKLLCCDIGSTNLKLQVFTSEPDGSMHSNGEVRLVNHSQSWLKADHPLEALSQWLSEIHELIVQDYAHEVDAIGFSTFREGLVGVSSTDQIVFAGSNMQLSPLGRLEDSAKVTTLAGWVCWKLTGQYCITTGQRDAGNSYISRVSKYKPCWALLIPAGENIQSDHATLFSVYLGGTDEQLGYVGTGLFVSGEPQLVIATGTFWSTSRIAAGQAVQGVRRTEGVMPFLSVDSCVLYKWGSMIEDLAMGTDNRRKDEIVPTRFFGRASQLWFADGVSTKTARQAAVDDLKSACAKLVPEKNVRAVVYGGGVRSQYARELIQEACEGLDLTFLDGDATLRGCAIIGKGV